MILRIVIALAVIGGVVWWFKHDRGGNAIKAPVTGSAAGSDGGGGRGAGGAGRVVTVQLAPATKEDVPIWLEGLGTVSAFQQVTVRPQVDGRLDKVLFTEGQTVKAGDLLAQIDPRPFMVQLHTAQGALARDRAQLDIAKKNYERYKGLQAQNLVSQQQVDEYAGQVGQYEGAVKIDLASVEQAQLQLDYANVKSPLTGTTGVRIVDAGNLVKASDPNGLVVITAVDPAAVIFTLPQDKLAAITGAQAAAAANAGSAGGDSAGAGNVPVQVWNRDGTQQLGDGTLLVLDNQVNSTTATLRLKAQIGNPKRALWPNAFVKARILVETRKDATTIPAVAIQRGPQGSFVYVVGSDNTAQMKTVEVASITGDKAIIGKGIELGEQVVVEGASQLRPGGKVAPAGHGSGSGRGGGAGGPQASAKSGP